MEFPSFGNRREGLWGKQSQLCVTNGMASAQLIKRGSFDLVVVRKRASGLEDSSSSYEAHLRRCAALWDVVSIYVKKLPTIGCVV